MNWSPTVEHFKHETLSLLDGVVGVDGAVFYAVDHELNAVDHLLYRVGTELLPDYLRYFHQLDPLHPRHYVRNGRMLVTLDEALPEAAREASRYYRDFMRPIGAHHETEIYLRDGANLIGGISLLRGTSSPAFTSGELSLLERIGPFLECGYRELRRGGTGGLDRYRLTAREIEIVQALCAGASNADIARRLGIALATVKSHLEHIYSKVGVRSRTRLMARLNAAVETHTFGG